MKSGRRFSSLSGVTLSEFIATLGPWKRVGWGFLSVLSIFAVHYAGFMFYMPSEIRDVVGHRFASSLLTAFSLHAISALAGIRFMIYAIMPFVWLLAALMLRLSYWNKFHFVRVYILIQRSYEKAALPVTIFFATIFFTLTYCLPEKNFHSNLWVFLTALAMTTIISFRRAILRPWAVVSRIRRGPSNFSNREFLPTVLYVAIGASLVGSFILGNLRYEKQLDTASVRVTTQCTSIKERILISTDDQFLMASENIKGPEFALIGRDFIVTLSPLGGEYAQITCESNRRNLE